MHGLRVQYSSGDIGSVPFGFEFEAPKMKPLRSVIRSAKAKEEKTTCVLKVAELASFR